MPEPIEGWELDERLMERVFQGVLDIWRDEIQYDGFDPQSAFAGQLKALIYMGNTAPVNPPPEFKAVLIAARKLLRLYAPAEGTQ